MRKVAIYARVSTEHEAQLSALENQVQYYDDIVNRHSDWEIYKRYIDEGITGTSIAKRKNFLQMLEDAKDGCFDLIITREVSRFARNTVDTLQVTRDLKRIGVEVYFTEDNIWTFKDDDGELKLTIMATLAQNESKKISQRVKAGQKISFQNGVIYGTGNIMGYDKVGKEMIVNEEQAEVVRFIYASYLNGKGTSQIKEDLERRGIPTATGKKRWHQATIGSMLKNPFYCGILEYRKFYVPDFLEQKTVRNTGQVEKVIVEGKHEPIISKEDFNRVQKIMSKRVIKIQKNRNVVKLHGISAAKNLWSKKLICGCGSSFNRTISHRYKDTITYQYVCYNKKNNGSLTKRKKLGIYIEGACDCKGVQDWKLNIMAERVFDELCHQKEEIIKIANKMIDNNILNTASKEMYEEEITIYENKIEINKSRIEKLIDLFLNEGINKEMFLSRKESLEIEIRNWDAKILEIKDKIGISIDSLAEKLENLKQIMNNSLYNINNNISDEIIDSFVESVIVHDDRFEWNLNYFDSITNSNEKVLLASLIITKDDVKRFIERYPEFRSPRMNDVLQVDIYI